MKLKVKRYISVLLILLMIIANAAAFPFKADASAENITALSEYRQYFRRMMGSFTRADMYKKNILASLTISQSMYESGWGTSNIAVKGKNLFGMKTFGKYEGLVYNGIDGFVCANYEEYRVFCAEKFDGYAWRAYTNWIESINDHSDLLVDYPHVIGVKDYKTACDAVVQDGYCPDAGYSDALKNYIEKYDLTQFDDITPNDYGVIAITMSDAEKKLSLNSTYKLSAQTIASKTVTQGLVWETTDSTIATVAQDGTVTAKKAGVVLITATIGNREACCIVTVTDVPEDKIAVTNSGLKVREDHSISSTEVGRFTEGTTITITGPIVQTNEEFGNWYPVTGISDKGIKISGWSCADFITLTNNTQVSKVAFNRYELNRDINVTYQLRYVIGSFFATDKALNWTSSDNTVASVENGLITTHKYGTATITATAVNGVSASCVVNVTNKTVKYNAVTTDVLNVRDNDSEDGTIMGTFARGVNIVITDNYSNTEGLIDDAWFYAEGVMRSGIVTTGYSNSKYIYLISKIESGEPLPVEFQFKDSSVAISDGCLYGVNPSSTVSQLLEHVINTSAAVYDASGKLLTATDRVATGCTLQLTENGEVKNKATIVLKGDVDGTGEIDSIDVLIVKKYILGTGKLEGIYLKAAMVTGSETISSVDFLMMKKQILGNYTIKQSIN